MKEETAKQKEQCNHFMVWNIQGGYAYYRCDKCNYIDGEKTFGEFKKQLLEKIERMEVNQANPDFPIKKDIKKQLK